MVVDHVHELAPAIRELLADERRLQELSARATRTAPEEVRWDAYADRVGRFLRSSPAAAPEQGALAGMGAALRDWLDGRAAQARAEMEEIHGEEQRVRADRDRIVAERDGLAAEREALVADRDAIAHRLTELKGRRSVQLALRVADMRRRDAR